MGAERSQLVVALQAALLRAAAEFGDQEWFAPHHPRVLATAAALDYVLMLATGTAGVRIPERDAERAIHEGMARAVDDLIASATTIAAERDRRRRSRLRARRRRRCARACARRRWRATSAASP